MSLEPKPSAPNTTPSEGKDPTGAVKSSPSKSTKNRSLFSLGDPVLLYASLALVHLSDEALLSKLSDEQFSSRYSERKIRNPEQFRNVFTVVRQMLVQKLYNQAQASFPKPQWFEDSSVFDEAKELDRIYKGAYILSHAAGTTLRAPLERTPDQWQKLTKAARARIASSGNRARAGKSTVKSFPDVNSMPDGTALPLGFFCSVPELYRLFHDVGTEEGHRIFRQLREMAIVSPDGSISMHSANWRSFTKAEPAGARKLSKLLDAGNLALSRDAPNGRFFCAPRGIFHSQGNWALYESFLTFQVPVTRSALENLQRGVNFTKFPFARAVIWGPIDPNVLAWAQPRELNDLGPIPDVEVVVPLILPSGRLYPLTLKGCRRSKPLSVPQPVELNDEDRKAVEILDRYFFEAKHRLHPQALARVDVPGVMGLRETNILTQVGPFPEKFIDLALAVKRWYGAVIVAMREAAKATKSIAFSAVNHPELQDFERFKVELNRRARAAFTLYRMPPDLVSTLSPRVGEFVDLYARDLHSLALREQDRVATEKELPRHAKRCALGYVGPSGGYPLPFDHVTLDMLRQFYALIRGDDHWSGGYESRYYDQVHAYPTSDRLPALLAARKPQRVFEIVITDPKRREPYTVLPVEDPQVGMGEFSVRNLKRLREWLFDHIRDFERRARSLGPHERAILHELNGALSSEYAKARCVAKEFLEARRNPSPPSLLMQRARNVIHATRNTTRRALAFEPALEFGKLESFIAIRDYEKVKYIHAIGADGVARFAEEADALRRPSHSELLGGTAMYGGGQTAFIRHEELFVDIAQWAFFNFLYQRENFPWRCGQLDDGTGHYRVPPDTLAYSANVILPELEKAGISTKNCRVEDRIAPGLYASWTRKRS